MSIRLGLLVETEWSWVTRVKRLRPLWRLSRASVEPLGAPSPPAPAQPPAFVSSLLERLLRLLPLSLFLFLSSLSLLLFSRSLLLLGGLAFPCGLLQRLLGLLGFCRSASSCLLFGLSLLFSCSFLLLGSLAFPLSLLQGLLGLLGFLPLSLVLLTFGLCFFLLLLLLGFVPAPYVCRTRSGRVLFGSARHVG